MMTDQEAREAALAPDQSFIVEAPAGSGKTSLLVQRYLRLLAVVERPESVVAMTFTRKAAAEMLDRVLEAFPGANSTEPLEPHQQKTRQLARMALEQDRIKGWRIRQNPERLQIQTIDALCTTLTRQMPVTSHLGGLPDIIEDATRLYREAARRTLLILSSQEPPLFRYIAAHFDNVMGNIESSIECMLARRDQWHVFRAPEDPAIVPFCRLLQYAEQALEHVFREHRAVDFTSITRAAIQALGGPESPSDLLYWLDYRIEHILVDEFQDTSRAQYDLLDRLTGQWSDGDGRTLFLVGDPMQSIYSFREAEVRLFLECQRNHRLGSVKLNDVRLSKNFRSSPELVDWTKHAFDALMVDDDTRHGGVKFRESQSGREASGVQPDFVKLISDRTEREHTAVLRAVRERQGKTAILVRSRTHLREILPALRDAGIAYEANEIDALAETQHIVDLLSLVRALSHPADRIAWLACLRAPWCGLTVSDLAYLAEHRPDDTIYDLLSDASHVAALSQDGRTRALRFLYAIKPAMPLAGRVPLRDLVEQTWLALGGPACLEGDHQLADAREFLKALEAAQQGANILDLASFDVSLQRLFARPAPHENAVQVMTIHAAKGLEFDTVVIPALEKATQSDTGPMLVWSQDEEGRVDIAARPPIGQDSSAYDDIKDHMALAERNELMRLLYVGVTRAKTKLTLIGTAAVKKDNTACNTPKRTSFLGLLWPQFQTDFEAERRRHPQPIGAGASSTRNNILRRLPSGWTLPAPEPALRWRAALQPAIASARHVSYEWVSNTGRHTGTVVHEMLKRIAADGLNAWPAERVQSLRTLFRSELLRLGVSAMEEPEATDKIVRALTTALLSERGRWLLGPHPEARSEWAIGGAWRGKLVSGTVDRSFRDDEGRLWIVDFKTSEHQGSKMEKFLEEEVRRYREQLETYAGVLSVTEAGEIRLGLYFPLLDAWRDWAYVEAAAATR